MVKGNEIDSEVESEGRVKDEKNEGGINGRIKPYVSANEVKKKVIEYLITEKGYLREDLTEDVVVEVDSIPIVIDVLVSVGGRNRILLMCESPSENLSLTSRLSSLVSKILDDPPPIAVATNYDDAEIVEIATGRMSFGIEKIPDRDVVGNLESPKISDRDDKIEKIKGLIKGLQSIKACKCGILRF
jgi:hypothetical protein